MDKKMIAFCGAYCGVCEWKEKVGCNGCQECQGNMFWGECDKAKCCIEKGFEHCGECPEMPCQMLLDLFNDPEHGDKGKRLNNLRNWAEGKYDYEKLGNAAQEQAKKSVVEERKLEVVELLFITAEEVFCDLIEYMRLLNVTGNDSTDIYYIFHLTYAEHNSEGYSRYKKFIGIAAVKEFIEQSFITEYL